MQQKIWWKFSVLLMALILVIPANVQALETDAKSSTEESTEEIFSDDTEKIQETNEKTLDEENQDFHNIEDSDEVVSSEQKEPSITAEDAKKQESLDDSMEKPVHTESIKQDSTEIQVSASNVIVDNIEFSFVGTDGSSTAKVERYHGPGGDVVIPSTVLNIQEGWLIPSPVTIIGTNAFRDKWLTNVEIPSSVKDIGVQAFAWNTLTSLNIPNSLQNIGSGAFYNNRITRLEIPNNLKTLGSDSFANNRLTSVNIQGGGVSIGPTAFKNNYIESIYIPPSVTFSGSSMFESNPLKYMQVNLANIEASRIKINSSVLSGVSERTILRALDYETGTVKESNISFGVDVSYAISQQYQLQSTTNRVWEEYIPEVQWVKDGNHLFGEVNPVLQLEAVTPSDSGLYYAVVDQTIFPNLKLEVGVETQEFVFEFSGTDGNSTATLIEYNGEGGDVIIPSEAINSESGWENKSTVTIIEANVFDNKKLTSVEIPDSVTHIRNFAFRNNSLSKIDLPKSLKSIGFEAFYQNQITDLDIPSGVTTLETGAFKKNTINTVKIPISVSWFGFYVFDENPLKYIDTDVKNVNSLVSILNPSSIGGVTERTILRALDYEIGTKETKIVTVGQSVEYAISQQYQLRSFANPIWDTYFPNVKWVKDGNTLENEYFESLIFGNIQESDSGVYSAIVDGVSFSELQLEVIPELEPEIPAIDPNEPTISPEGVNPEIEGLSIRYASDIQFNSVPFSLLTQSVLIDNQDNQPMITIQDMRSRNDRSGWELLVSQDSVFMNGAEVVMNPYVHQDNQENLLINPSEELILNDTPQRFAGTKTITGPNPFGIVSIGMESSERPMTLRVPGRTGVGSYEMSIHWQLVTGP